MCELKLLQTRRSFAHDVHCIVDVVFWRQSGCWLWWKTLSFITGPDCFFNMVDELVAPIPAMVDQTGTNHQDKTVDNIRTVFPETWLWSNHSAGYINYNTTQRMTVNMIDMLYITT